MVTSPLHLFPDTSQGYIARIHHKDISEISFYQILRVDGEDGPPVDEAAGQAGGRSVALLEAWMDGQSNGRTMGARRGDGSPQLLSIEVNSELTLNERVRQLVAIVRRSQSTNPAGDS